MALSVVGHKSALAFGLMGEGVGVPVVAMLGRVSLAFLIIEIDELCTSSIFTKGMISMPSCIRFGLWHV